VFPAHGPRDAQQGRAAAGGSNEVVAARLRRVVCSAIGSDGTPSGRVIPGWVVVAPAYLPLVLPVDSSCCAAPAAAVVATMARCC
jgi:hypothetical protein